MSQTKSGLRSWRVGRFKENVKCIRCGKRLEEIAKLCDECIVEMHVESILTDKTLLEITKRYDIYYTTVVRRINALKKSGRYPELFFKVVKRFQKRLNNV